MDPSIVLFDLDGTLTEPRGPIASDVVKALKKLSKVSAIGIVTGSNIEYVREQCLKELLQAEPHLSEEIAFYPCNGTQEWVWYQEDSVFEISYANNMRKQLGEESLRDLLIMLLDWQSKLSKGWKELPLSGTFVQYRDSMVNWCPIGRVATQEQRNKFKELDMETGFRAKIINNLRKDIDGMCIGVVVAKGGDTSFDIYPVGWDKTFVLGRINSDETWFVGDRCTGDGNDRHLYEALPHNRRFSTTGPKNTIEIINAIIRDIKDSDRP